MAFYSCDEVITTNGDKGSSSVWLGYIVDLAHVGNCIGVTELETSGAKLVSEKCDIGSPNQNWQFSKNTFYSYYVVDFLGNTKGPYPSGKTTDTFPSLDFQTSPGYSFSHDGQSFSVEYDPEYTGGSNNTLAFDPNFWNVSGK